MEHQITAVQTDYDTYTTLTFIEGDDDSKVDDSDEESEEEMETDDQGASSGYEPSPQKKQCYPERSRENMQRVVEYRNSKLVGKRSLSSVQKMFRWVRDANHMQYIERVMKKDGSKTGKLNEINEYVLQRFVDAVENRCRIHDSDLTKWALAKKRIMGWEDFKASPSWLLRFKKRSRIAVRTITHIVSKKSIENMDVITAKGMSFVDAIKPLINPSTLSSFYNVDQSGFKKELHSGGTLAFKGSRKIEAKVQSVGSTTHSYTIMPLISADGILHTPMFVVLQETGDTFGPRVSQTMKKPPNLRIACSKSGLVKKQLMNEWFLKIFLKGYPLEKHLLCDSLSTYKNTSSIDEVKPDNQIYHLHIIPEGTTGSVQPLDVFFFRQWKSFVKKISDHVIMEDLNIQFFQRDNILTLQSLVHNQFSASRFNPFIRQAWVKAGYLNIVEDVENPVRICFDHLSACFCEQSAVIRCSWCDQQLCFKHFFEKYHTHNIEIQT